MNMSEIILYTTHKELLKYQENKLDLKCWNKDFVPDANSYKMSVPMINCTFSDNPSDGVFIKDTLQQVKIILFVGQEQARNASIGKDKAIVGYTHENYKYKSNEEIYFEVSVLLSTCNIHDNYEELIGFKINEKFYFRSEQEKVNLFLSLIENDILNSSKNEKSLHSTYEGYAKLLEKTNALWENIKLNNLDKSKQDIVQIMAVAFKYLKDLE
jgi:hypothetical protein